MARIITSYSVDRNFTNAPVVSLHFADRDANGEHHGRVVLVDDDARACVDKDGNASVAAMLTILAAKEAAVTVPAIVAEKLSQASEAEQRTRRAQAQVKAANERLIATDAERAAKQAEADVLAADIAARRKELADLKAEAEAAKGKAAK